jgi:Cu-Zn family superoxide dismutase
LNHVLEMGQTRKRTKQSGGVAVFQTSTVRGEVTLEQSTPHTVTIHATFFSLPAGKHGFHIHMAGDLRGKGCQGACDHYHVGAPTNHGDEPGSKRQRHTGDLGNIEMPRTGPFQKTWQLKGTTVRDLWGRSIIVHADEDDLGLGGHDDSKRTGHSGARIACAIIGRTACLAKH